METTENLSCHVMFSQFKIDLIVWKQSNSKTTVIDHVEFKIDLIVWKHWTLKNLKENPSGLK